MSEKEICKNLGDIPPNTNQLEKLITCYSEVLSINDDNFYRQQFILENDNPFIEENESSISNDILQTSIPISEENDKKETNSAEVQSIEEVDATSTTAKNKKYKNKRKYGRNRKSGRRKINDILSAKGSLRGMIDYGKEEKCFKCNKSYDMNYLFIYSENTTPKIENKPYICFWCSLSVESSIKLRSWDVHPDIPTRCYRCLCNRSKERFLPYQKNCYCLYCSLKKKREYLIKSYISNK